jgi:hypothetical protein
MVCQFELLKVENGVLGIQVWSEKAQHDEGVSFREHNRWREVFTTVVATTMLAEGRIRATPMARALDPILLLFKVRVCITSSSSAPRESDVSRRGARARY